MPPAARPPVEPSRSAGSFPASGLQVVSFGAALALPGALWWTYFTDYHAAEHALAGEDTERRSLLAIRVYYFGHIPVLLGIVVAAVGIHATLAHPADPEGWPAATALAGGVALFLVGIAHLRHALSIGSPWPRISAAAAALPSIPLGAMVSARLHLACVLGVVGVMLLVNAPRAPAGAVVAHAGEVSAE